MADDQSQTTEQLQPAEAAAADPVAEEVVGDAPVVEEVTEVAGEPVAVDPASPAVEDPSADDAA